jgi:hypothetical protein
VGLGVAASRLEKCNKKVPGLWKIFPCPQVQG